MKKYFLFLVILKLSFVFSISAQDSFTYTVIEDNPNNAFKYLAGIRIAPRPIWGKHSTNAAIGIQLNRFNVYNRFSFDVYSDFQTGIKFFTIDNNSDFDYENLKRIRYNKSSLTITTKLFSSFKTKEKVMTLKSGYDVNYVTFINHKVSRDFGLRLGYEYNSLPLSNINKVDILYPDSVNIYLYGLRQQTINVGLSYAYFTNFHILTDVFGEVKKKSMYNFYFDAMFLLKNQGLYYYTSFDGVNYNKNQTEYETSANSLMDCISFRLGVEAMGNLSSIKNPIAIKYGFELVKHEYFKNNSYRINSLYVQFRMIFLYLM